MRDNYHTNELKPENLNDTMAKKYNKLKKKGDKNETDERKNSS